MNTSADLIFLCGKMEPHRQVALARTFPAMSHVHQMWRVIVDGSIASVR